MTEMKTWAHGLLLSPGTLWKRSNGAAGVSPCALLSWVPDLLRIHSKCMGMGEKKGERTSYISGDCKAPCLRKTGWKRSPCFA